MKKLMMSFLATVFLFTTASAQNINARSGFDGDFFSLEGAIEMFKNSRNLQEFEKRLNSKDSWVNNLDLNHDRRIDYIRVEHQRQGDFHAIILQVPISRNDLQDIAVIEIEKTNSRRALLQIVGDKYLYGDQVIAEPFDVNVRSDQWSGPSVNETYERGFINVFYWPIVSSLFNRGYQVYVSPYRWSYYPTYWQPWRPYTWNIFRPRIVVFQRYHRVVNVHRVHRVHNFYTPNRRYSSNVFRRTNQVRVRNGRQPYYRANRPNYNRNNNQLNSRSRVGKGRSKNRNSSLRSRRSANIRSNDQRVNSRVQSSASRRKNARGTVSGSRINSDRNIRNNKGLVQSKRSRSNRNIKQNSTSAQNRNTNTRNSRRKKQTSNINRSSSRISKSTRSKRSTSRKH